MYIIAKNFLLVLFIAAFVCKTTDSFSQPGTLDSSFGINGKVYTAIPGGFGNEIQGLAVQQDGKIITSDDYLATGTFLSTWAIVRYNVNGNLDSSFGTNGINIWQNGQSSVPYSVALQTDGKIIVAGYLGAFAAVVRYNTNGSFDSSFGTNGQKLISIASASLPYSVVIQNDEKIVAGGYYSYNDALKFMLFRLNSNGSIDSTFGTNGIDTSTAIGIFDDEIRSLAIQSDEKIIATGYSKNNNHNYVVALARYNTNGNLDSAFGINGIVTTSVMTNAQAYSIALQSDSKVVISGFSQGTGPENFVLARYNTDGSLDQSFYGSGVDTSLVGNSSLAYSVKIENDGKIIAGGGSGNSTGGSVFAIAGYLSNGELDSSFAIDGIDTTTMGDGTDDGGFVMQLFNSRIYLAGTDGTNGAIVAYKNDEGTLPVVYLYFDAVLQNGKGYLDWNTTKEINSNYFEVQKSIDGINFTPIGDVNAAGNSISLKSYSFIDNKLITGTNYYRLKLIDKDGKFTYSQVRTINEAISFAASIYPNPVQNNLSLNFSSDKAMAVQVEIINNEGKVITTQQMQVAAGASTQSINTASLSNGAYYVRLVSEEGETELKFVKGQ